MALSPNMLLNSSSRGRVYIGVAAFSLIALIFFFRTSFTHSPTWSAQTPTNAPPVNAPPILKDKTTAAAASSISSITTAPPKTSVVAPATTLLSTPPAATPPTSTADDACKDFPDTSDILLVMKTGATEAYDKLPVHFMTTLRCLKDYVIFSDVEMEIAEHHLVDTLDEISDEVKKDNGDFKLYDTLKTYRKLLEDPRSLKSGTQGWNLDKYKFLPMLLKTWRYCNDAKWYVFVEADTMVDWANMRTFLNKLKPTTPYYIGSPTYLDIEFAHGGTGYIISQAAMAKGVGQHPDISQKYDKDVHGFCCGDRMIARVMLDENIKLTKAWPMLNGEKPITLPYGDNQWCQPVLTMHHMTAQEVSQVWNYQQERKRQGIKVTHATFTSRNSDPDFPLQEPMLWKDVFYHFVKDAFVGSRHDWSNLSNGQRYKPDPELDFNGRKWHELPKIERASAESPANCQKLCDSQDDCYQWEHHDEECKLGHAFTLGGTRAPENGKPFVSGWKLAKIGAFQQKMKNCTGGADWHYTEAERPWLS